MPNKKPSLFDVSGREPDPVKLPTLRQYLKEITNVEYPIYARIEIIWFPGQWDNYSLQCEHFRVSISSSHPLYKLLEDGIVAAITSDDRALLVRIDDATGTIGISESTVWGQYKPIGHAGYKFYPTDGAN
jgi:hypothetical protein